VWHVHFECPATADRPEIVALRTSSGDFLLQICAAVLDAVEHDSQSMSNTAHAGVSHDATGTGIFATTVQLQVVRDALHARPLANVYAALCWHCHLLLVVDLNCHCAQLAITGMQSYHFLFL
jgi:hypothetical protein